LKITTDNGAKLNVNGTIRSNDTNGLGLGSIAGYRRIQYGSDNATSFTLLTDGNAYAGLYAGAATFSSTLDTGGRITITADSGNEQFNIRRASNTNQQLILGYHSDGYGRIQAVEQNVAFRPLVLNQSGGNVLIGTTTDSGFKLNVNGNVYANTLTLGHVGLNISDYNFYSQTISGAMGILGHNVRASASVANQVNVVNSGWYTSMIKMYYSEGITFHTSPTVYSAGDVYPMAGTERMRITFTGRIGIGTNDPIDQLNVAGGITSTGLSNPTTTSVGSLQIGYDGTTGVIRTWNSSPLLFSNYNHQTFETSGSIRMRITSGGNVGIGTTSPDAIFHVARSSAGGVGGQVVIDNPASSTLGNTAEISFLTDAGASGAGTRNARILAVNENAGDGAANLQFHTWNGSASAERMRITSGGNVLIGTTTNLGSELNVNSTIRVGVAFGSAATIAFGDAGTPYWSVGRQASSGNFSISSYALTAMTIIPTSGNVLIGTTTDAGYTLNLVGNAQFIKSSTSTAMVVGLSGVTGSIIRFSYNGGFVGSISTDGSNTAYNTSSDYRLKEQVRAIDNPLEKVMKLNPVNFKYKNSKTVQDGFIAHEIQEILPYLVTGEKDGAEMQEVDYSKLTPILIAAIKELKQEIDKLRNK